MSVLLKTPELRWTLEPGVIILLFLFVYLYTMRVRKLTAQGVTTPWWRITLFFFGLGCVFIALISPLDHLAEQLLFAHMIQHLILLDLAPILMLLGLTKAILRPLTKQLHPVEVRLSFFFHPAVAVMMYAGMMWLWHVPTLYDAAVQHPALHVLEHMTMGLAGGFYWWLLLSPVRRADRLNGLAPVLYMATTKIFVGLLGIVLTFAPQAIYPYYEHQPRFWGLSALDDQTVAGALMALEQSMIMGVALALLFVRGMNESERAQLRKERYEQTTDLSSERP